jgi:hypothetical protein
MDVQSIWHLQQKSRCFLCLKITPKFELFQIFSFQNYFQHFESVHSIFSQVKAKFGGGTLLFQAGIF